MKKGFSEYCPQLCQTEVPTLTNVKAALDTYCQALVNVARAAAPTNLSKVSGVIVGNYESPSRFLEHLWEAHWEFTSIDPDAPENQQVSSIAFVTNHPPIFIGS